MEETHESEIKRKRERKPGSLHRTKPRLEPHLGNPREPSYRTGPSGDTVLAAHRGEKLDSEPGAPGFRLGQFANVPAGAFPGAGVLHGGANFPGRTAAQHAGWSTNPPPSHPVDRMCRAPSLVLSTAAGQHLGTSSLLRIHAYARLFNLPLGNRIQIGVYSPHFWQLIFAPRSPGPEPPASSLTAA